MNALPIHPDRRRQRSRRRSLAAVAAATMIVAGLPALAATAAAQEPAELRWGFNPVTELTAATFATPPDADMPWVRWNVPVHAVNATLEAELQDMYDKGIRGVEIGQGGFPNNDQLTAIYTKANALGIAVSLSHGPTKGPTTGYTFNNDNVRKSLFAGRAAVAAGQTFAGAVPKPVPQAGRTETLVAVLAYRCTATCAPTGVADLDRSSVIDLTDTVTGTNTDGFADASTAGAISWTAPAEPAGATWQLIGFWARGVFAQSDPLSAAGHQEVVDAMRGYFTPQVAELIRRNDGEFFYDSHSSDRGAPREVWTNTFASDFEERAGYDLIPNLPAALRGTFTFSDGSHRRIHDDITTVRTDLWLDVHVLPMQQFVRAEYDAVLRVQPEGENSFPIYDMAAVASVLDRPEHENLFASDEIDNYLPIASANHMTGNTWYSTECCALAAGNYLGTYEDFAIRMAKSYAGGITKLVYHTYAYADSPAWKWPGYSNFGLTSFGTAWGPRSPIWGDALAYNMSFARHEQVLKQGSAKVDVAVFYQNFLYPEAWSTAGGFRTWRDMGLQNAGYTRDYLSPELMKLPNATVEDGVLAADGPSYKALIIDTALEPATDPVKTSMPLDAAERILEYARDGLPVVLVGDLPDRTTGLSVEDDAALVETIAQLAATPGVHRVSKQADVPAKLAELGIQPAARPTDPTTLVSQRRVDEATDTSYFYLYNEGRVGADGRPEQSIFEPAEVCAGAGGHVCAGSGAAVSTEVAFEGSGYPFLLDAASGEITPIAEYRVEDGRVVVPLHFERDESKMIALTTDPERFGIKPAAVHAVQTDADGVVLEDDRLLARSASAGVYSTTLGDGRVRSVEVGDVPAAIDLTGARWQLDAEDWKPAHDYLTTFGPAATQTVKSPVSVTLDGLKPWREIPELKDASGVGEYTTTLTLPGNWTPDHGAILDLGTVVDSFAVTVNGEDVDVDQVTGRADLRDELRAGENTLTVRVSTTLINRLASLDTAVRNRGHYQNYGLLGPVTLSPYASVEIDHRAPAIQSVELDQRQRMVVTATDDLSDAVRIQYSTVKNGQDASPWREYTAPLQADSASTVSFRAIDEAGNVSEITEVNRKDLR